MADGAYTFAGVLIDKLTAFFNPHMTNPPLGGGVTEVALVAGDSVPIPALLSGECHDPFVWVRFLERSKAGGTDGLNDCRAQRWVRFEAGIARCSPMDIDESISDLHEQAVIQMDDSWRIEMALCAAANEAMKQNLISASRFGTGGPIGPSGGVIVWTQTIGVQL